MTERALLDAVLDDLIERYGSGELEPEAVAARREFEARAGRVFEEDEFYEARTAAFLEWYVTERPLSMTGKTPAAERLGVEEDPERRAALKAWALSHRSLFEVAAVEEGAVRVVDLLGGAHVRVDERRKLAGVTAGDLVEARLVAHEERIHFGRTFLFHPRGAREAILSHARRLRAEGRTRADVVDHVASLRVRAERYSHVAPERVYEATTGELSLKDLPR